MNTAPTDIMLEAVDLQVRRGTRTVLSVDYIDIRQGEILALIGPNGAGKSTLLLTLALLLKPTTGTIRIAGQTVTDGQMLAYRRRMAAVFQEPLLLDTSVADNVSIGMRLRGVPKSERSPRVATWLQRFGIAHLAKRSARMLSGGEAQRTSLARGFALHPEIIFLDEPFSALDAPTRAELTNDLVKAQRETATPMVLVTHDLNEALSMADRAAVLIDGQLRQIGPADEVFNAPVDADVAAFVGVDTIAPGVVVGNEEGLAQVKVGGCVVEVVSDIEPGRQVLLALRPEDVTIHLADKHSRSSARNALPGRVIATTPRGGQVQVAIECGFRVTAAITRRSAAEMGLAEGAAVIAAFKATSAHLIPRS